MKQNLSELIKAQYVRSKTGHIQHVFTPFNRVEVDTRTSITVNVIAL